MERRGGYVLLSRELKPCEITTCNTGRPTPAASLYMPLTFTSQAPTANATSHRCHPSSSPHKFSCAWDNSTARTPSPCLTTTPPSPNLHAHTQRSREKTWLKALEMKATSFIASSRPSSPPPAPTSNYRERDPKHRMAGCALLPEITPPKLRGLYLLKKSSLPPITPPTLTAADWHDRNHRQLALLREMLNNASVVGDHRHDHDLTLESRISPFLRSRYRYPSTGCSGTKAVRYGMAKSKWFLNATVVLPSGEVIKTRRISRKSAAGFDVTKLFVGAEGTLGIETEGTVPSLYSPQKCRSSSTLRKPLLTVTIPLVEGGRGMTTTSGTNTDGVIIDITKSNDPSTRGVVASFKHATTPDITTGIELAVKKVLEASGVDPGSERILGLTIGTTSIDLPQDLKDILNGHTAIIHGGLQIDGRTINDVQETEVLEQAKIIREKGLTNVVLVGVYSPLDVEGKHEYKARDILRRELGDGVNIICSCDVGHVGFVERENASIPNASIMSFAQRTIRGYRRAMKRLGLKCPLYLTQNDGTLTTAARAARLPIKTFSSGATNSMRRASYLAGLDLKNSHIDGSDGFNGGAERKRSQSMIVVDVGGTTTDVGVLLPSGFPRQAAAFIEVAGVRTKYVFTHKWPSSTAFWSA
ncbi:Hydantoinase/oxoprolinase-domain-containing protein [Flammula alnicola]|nr:Hydantoinase/oxoprolinase-domain-containing protein [Flammula alnicola]